MYSFIMFEERDLRLFGSITLNSWLLLEKLVPNLEDPSLCKVVSVNLEVIALAPELEETAEY